VQSVRAGILDEIAAADGGLQDGTDPARPLGATRMMAVAAQGTRR
jgi:hypothetical protein